MICKEDYENTKSAIDVIAEGEGDRYSLTRFQSLTCAARFGFDGCSYQKNAQRLLDLLEYAEQRPEPKQDTLQDVIEDCSKDEYEYWGCDRVDNCESCPSLINGRYPSAFYGVALCRNAQRLDIKRRLEAIQKRMGGDQSCQN